MKVLSVLVIFIWSTLIYTSSEDANSTPDGVTLSSDELSLIANVPYQFAAKIKQNMIEKNRQLEAERKAKDEKDRQLEAERKAKDEKDRQLEAERKAKDEKDRQLEAERKAKSNIMVSYVILSTQHARLEKLVEFVPSSHFECAMGAFKYDTDPIYKEFIKKIPTANAAQATSKIGVPPHQFPIPAKLPQRIYKLYLKDQYMHENVDERKPHFVADDWWKDKQSFGKWYVVATANPKDLLEHVDEKCATFGKNLQGNLTEYYNRLNSQTKEQRGYFSKEKFAEYFAAVIVRSYRLANQYLYGYAPRIRSIYDLKKRKNEDPYEAYKNSIVEVIPYWHFDQEHIDLINIFRKSAGKSELIYNNFEISVRRKNEIVQVIIPGVNSCGPVKLQPSHFDMFFSPKP